MQIEMAYYEIITDAIKGCFSFDIESDAYTVDTTLAKDASYSEALDRAIKLERR